MHQPALDAEAAARVLRRQEIGGFSVHRLLGGLKPDRMQGLDLVFVPHWYCSFRVVMEGAGPRWGARSQHVAPALWTMVDALVGTVLRLADQPPLVTRDLAMLAPAITVPASIDEAAAVTKAMDALRWDLRIRGRQRFAPRHLEPADVRLGHVPFWIGYYRGPAGQLRARAVHGVESSIQDGRFTRELLRALDRVA